MDCKCIVYPDDTYLEDNINTFLVAAVQDGNVEKVRSLMAKVDLETKLNLGPKLLYESIKYEKATLVGLFLDEFKIDPNSRNLDGNTPLHLATAQSCTKIVQMLLNKGADPSLCNKDGKTPLFSAMCNGHLETLKVLAVEKNSGWSTYYYEWRLDIIFGANSSSKLSLEDLEQIEEWRKH